MNFTDDQQKIIDARNCNLLVSAAAGSGKTAVMVERIVRLINDPDNPVDIDEFLIVTFTRAAASQMREKIAQRIGELLDDDPANMHLQKQAALIHNALITTIDSFCLYVLRNNFGEVDIDPGFRIADEGEMKLLKKDVLEKVIEDYYSKEDDSFRQMAEAISYGAVDTSIEKAIGNIYDTAMSSPWPYEWLSIHAKDYYINPDEQRLSGDWFEVVLNAVIDELKYCSEAMKAARDISQLPAGPYMYGETLDNEAQMLEDIADFLGSHGHEISYDELRTKVSAITFGKLDPCRDKSVDSDIKDRVLGIRNKIKKNITALIDKFLSRSEDAHIVQMNFCEKIVKKLCEVTASFKQALDEAMRQKGILSFADCEHLALDILVQKTGETWKPTVAAEEYRRHFAYVFVDEYQDSNMIQELVLSAVSGEPDDIYNRFMVGDIKQSIYRFRQAKPEIFIEKYDEYIPDDSKKNLIDLSKNFRSRKQVLDFTNAVCERIMCRKLGGVTYDDKAALFLGAAYPEEDNPDYVAELNIFEPGDEDPIQAEAAGVAMRIKELMQNMQVRVGNSAEETRPLRYGDIVILFRSRKNYIDVFKKVLTDRGIPVHVEGSGGYFSSYEIRTLMNLLRIIVNPLQDICFYGVMESAIGGFTSDEIASIRTLYVDSLSDGMKTDEGYLSDACKYVATIEDSLGLKTKSFIELINKYRELSEYLTVEELLWNILKDTDYRTIVFSMNNGEKRLANVDMLLHKASDYTKTSYFGLHNFIRYIDLLEKYEVDEAESETVDENADVVRIMSIHKSKGLEFPVCFVSSMAKGFNKTDAREAVVIDSELGLGIKYSDAHKRVMSKTLRSAAVAERIVKESISEELRILYVAFTRAQEKLILTACDTDYAQAINEYRDLIKRGETSISPLLSFKAQSYLDWIYMCIASVSGEEVPIGYVDELKLKISLYDTDYIKDDLIAEEIDRELIREQYNHISQNQNFGKNDSDSMQEYAEYIKRLFEMSYGHKELAGLYTKASVSDLKHEAMEEETQESLRLINEGISPDTKEYEPRFISGREDEPRATLRGSAFHRVLELLDFEQLSTYIQSDDCLNTLYNVFDDFTLSGQLVKAQRNILGRKNMEQIVHFLQSDTALRMQKAQAYSALYKEEPFMMAVPANHLDESLPQTESLLVQGIIDAFWKEEDGYVILDYKTDRVQNADELIARYKTQLDYYEMALNMMHKNVKEKLIYSFALGETISL